MDYDSLLKLVKKRRSVRKLKTEPIPDEFVDKIIEVARWATSGANSQPWQFIVVKKEEFRKIFYNVKTVEKENLFQEFNIYELTRYMGKKYLEVSKNFVQVSIPVVEDLLFEHMLYLYYKMSVVGSMRILEQEWASNHLKINAFKKALIKEYHRTYGELVAPVQVEYDAGGDR